MCSQSRCGMPLGPDQLDAVVNHSHVASTGFIAPLASRAHGVRARPTSTITRSSTRAIRTEMMMPAQISLRRSRR